MDKRLTIILIGDVAIVGGLLLLVMTHTAPILPVGITAMILGVSFNYLILRRAAVNPKVGTAEGSFENAGLRKLAIVLAGIGGLLLVIGGIITLFASRTGDADAVVTTIIVVGFGFYFIRVYLNNK